MSDVGQCSDPDMELEEFILDYIDPDENDEASVQTVSQRGRGRPRIQEKWIRVVNVDATDANDLRTFEMGPDLLLAAGLPSVATTRNTAVWAPTFDPRKFVKDHVNLSKEDYRLSQDKLFTLGKQATQLRLQLR